MGASAAAWRVSLGAALAFGGPVAAQPDADVARLLNMSLDELMDVGIRVASRSEATLLEAPAVVSVLTADDLRRIGARDLRDALRYVPGFEPGIRSFGYYEFGFRGVITDNSEKVLILLDGMPVNEHLEGSGSIVFADFPLDNLDRIEVIRGPGSALYGSNAFVAVISLISRPLPEAPQVVTLGAGSFDTGEASLRVGRRGDGWQWSGFLHLLDSDGDAAAITSDALQIRPDPPWFAAINQGVSLAGSDRGVTDNARRKLTAQWQLGFGDFKLNALLVDARKGPYIGTLFTVNEGSEAHPRQFQLDASKAWQLGENSRLEARLHGRRYLADNLWNSMPPGYRVPTAEGGLIEYSRGQYDRQGGTQRTLGAELRSTTTIGSRHTVIAGLAIERQSLYDLVNLTNLPGAGPESMIDAGAIILGEPERELRSAYLQDQWQASETLEITSGLRFDDYDDVGSSLTPRLAAVWQPREGLSLKALYGEAFRAPTFVESYLFAYGGFGRGNLDNRPETIETLELAGIYRFNPRWLAQLNVYRNQIGDLLQFVPNAAGYLEYRNQPDLTVVTGAEAELRFEPNARWAGFLQLSHQHGQSRSTGAELVGMASWQGSLGIDFLPSERLQWHAVVHAVGRRQRQAIDSRPPLGGYAVVNLIANWQPADRHQLQLRLHNLFDREQRFPDLSANVSGDFPWEQRAISLQWTWRR